MIGEIIFLVLIFGLTAVGFTTTINYLVDLWYYYKQVYQNKVAFRDEKA